jgi:hypothetical protein
MAQGEAKQQEQQQQRQEAAQARQATLASQVGAQRAAQEREISAENARAGLQRDRDTSADKRLQDTLNSRESEGDKNRGAPGKTVQEQAYASLVKGGMDPEAAGQEVMKWGKNQPQQSLSQMYAAAMQSGDKLQQQKLLKAQADFKRAGAPEPGNYMPVIDPDGNIIGGWNPKANHYVSAGSNPTLAAAVGTAPGSEQPSIPAKPAAGAASGNLSASVDKSWASEYLAKGKYTGPDDEALMERFFDVVKPSSGFRMSQPQIDMLTGARSWMESAEGRALHAKTGTWFAPDQRAQIVGTINSVADAKLAAAGGGRRLPTGGQSQTLTNKVHASGGAGQTAPPRPANVPAGYQYNANGPKGAGWYRPQ